MASVAVPSRRRLAPEARRGQISAAAMDLFARQGFARTTTRQIARKAGIAEGTIYRYYRTKHDILFSFLETAALESLQSLMSGLEGSDDELFVRRFLETRLAIGERNAKLFKVLIGEALFDPALARHLSERIILPASRLIGNYIERRIGEGTIRSVDPLIAARSLVDHFFANTLVWRGLAEPYLPRRPRRKVAENLASIFLDGVRAGRSNGQTRRGK